MKNSATGAMIRPAKRPVGVPKFNNVMDIVDSSTAVFIHCKSVRSLAKNVLGSTRTDAAPTNATAKEKDNI